MCPLLSISNLSNICSFRKQYDILNVWVKDRNIVWSSLKMLRGHLEHIHHCVVSASSRPFTPQKTGNTSVHYIRPHGGKWPFLFLVVSTNNRWNSCVWEYTHSTGIPTVVCNSLTHTHCYLYCYLHCIKVAIEM